MKSLYAQYLEEKTNRKVLETEHGFVTYEIIGDACYIADIFTIKEERLGGLMMQMCLEVGDIAKRLGAGLSLAQSSLTIRTLPRIKGLFGYGDEAVENR